MPSNIFWGMQHLNANVLAAVCVDTTGPTEDHEIIEVAVVPLDHMLRVHNDLILFNMRMQPRYIENIDWKHCRLTRVEVAQTVNGGFTADRVADMLYGWFCKLDLNERKKIIPFGYKYTETRAALIKWLGQEMYSEMFSDDYRDLLVAAHFINDRQCCKGEPAIYAKQRLRWLAKYHDVEMLEAGGSSLSDCYTIAQTYRRMLVNL